MKKLAVGGLAALAAIALVPGTVEANCSDRVGGETYLCTLQVSSGETVNDCLQFFEPGLYSEDAFDLVDSLAESVHLDEPA